LAAAVRARIPVLLTILKNALRRRRSAGELGASGIEHYRRGELQAAEQHFREAASAAPGDIVAWNNLAASLLRQKKFRAALPVLAHMIELEPARAEAHFDLGTCYNRLKNNGEAIRSYERAIAIKPDLHDAHAHVVNAYMDSCDWDAVDRWRKGFEDYRKSHSSELWSQRIQVFVALTLLPHVTKELAVVQADRIARSTRGGTGSHDTTRRLGDKKRMRIGYVSSDFNDHAVAHLTYRLYENHDRSRFEVHAYSIGPDDASACRKHIERTCDRFTDVREESDERTAARIRDDGIDILMDMNAYTESNRMRIFAYRPAPVQVNYLGHPGTSGASFIDYFITDAAATPPGHEAEFTENLVYLPDTYQANHDAHEVSAEPMTRAQFELPEDAFVFCDFNQARKIDRTVFRAWMAILKRVPGSVLWLMKDDDLAESNLRRHAALDDVEPGRLVFSPPLPNRLHLARYRLADLFLDTFAYNAHTGTSDALWAGLPVLTCPGRTFATRVASSLLRAAGLPQLIAPDIPAYEDIAVGFAQHPERLRELKRELSEKRRTCALFDAPRYVRHLESAYEKMFDIAQRGEPPRSFRA
jgi:predicted O-linked N-acetylglucosamine transferase (SPINDLY family)